MVLMSSKAQSGRPYLSTAMAQLSAQMHYAPPVRRQEQLRQAERLLDQLNPQQLYPWDFVNRWITGHHAEGHRDAMLVGDALRQDLLLLVDHLSRLTPMPEDDEPSFTAQQLAEHWRVSTKTIQRYRDRGLRWRWVRTDAGARPKLRFTESAVAAFERSRGRAVARAGRFTQISEAQRKRIIHRARRLSQVADVSAHRIITHVARRMGRSTEAVRLLVQRHDLAHPDQAVFPRRSPTITARQRRVMARAYAMGVPVRRIAQRFGRTRATVHRAIRLRRAAVLKRVTLTSWSLPWFDDDQAAQRHLDDAERVCQQIERATDVAGDGGTDDSSDRRDEDQAAPSSRLGRASSVPTELLADLPEPLAKLYSQPMPDPSQQWTLLVGYNLLKHRAANRRDQLDRHEPSQQAMTRIEQDLAQAGRFRRAIICSSLPVVRSVCRRHQVFESAGTNRQLVSLLTQGQAVLIEAIEQFKPAGRGAFADSLRNTLMRRLATYHAGDPVQHHPAGIRARRRDTPSAAVLHRMLVEAGAVHAPAAVDGRGTGDSRGTGDGYGAVHASAAVDDRGAVEPPGDVNRTSSGEPG